MPANLENSSVATGLEKVSFHSNLKEKQCKKIEENNRMGKTRDLFKKIRIFKGMFHTKVGTIKERKGMDLTEAEDIKKRWQEHRRTIKKFFMNQIIMMV